MSSLCSICNRYFAYAELVNYLNYSNKAIESENTWQIRSQITTANCECPWIHSTHKSVTFGKRFLEPQQICSINQHRNPNAAPAPSPTPTPSPTKIERWLLQFANGQLVWPLKSKSEVKMCVGLKNTLYTDDIWAFQKRSNLIKKRIDIMYMSE